MGKLTVTPTFTRVPFLDSDFPKYLLHYKQWTVPKLTFAVPPVGLLG